MSDSPRQNSNSLPRTPPPLRLGGSTAPLHLVLVEPQIPPNTGNVARLCAAVDAWLHLVEPLGFDLDHRKVKRAGLDYWPSVRLSVHPTFEALASRLNLAETFFFTKFADQIYTEPRYPAGSVLVFGKETTGLPDTVRTQYADRCVRIPTTDNVRSLNLSNAVAIAAYEVIRQNASLTS